MKPFTTYPALLAIVLLWTSCGPTIYVPNTINAPLLTEQHDFRASVGTVAYAPESSVDFMGAYAATDHLAFTGSAFFMSGTVRESRPRTNRLLEGAMGVYNTFGPDKNGQDLGRLELFAGFGRGKGEDAGYHTRFFVNQDRVTGRYNRFYLQPAIGLRTKIFDASFATRISRVNFSQMLYYNGSAITRQSTPSFSTVEPVLTLALGYKYVKYYMQIGGTTPLGDRRGYDEVTDSWLRDGHFNVGLVGSPWKEPAPESPPIKLSTPEESDNEPRDSVTTPLVDMPIDNPVVSICLRDSGSPDGDIVDVSFNGALYFRMLELARKETCFQVEMIPGQENLLHITAISEGRVAGVTVQVLVKGGKKQRLFYVHLKEGETETVRFTWGW